MSFPSRKSIAVAPATEDTPSGIFIVRNGKLYQIDWAAFKEEIGASLALTGIPTVPTAASATNTTQAASTAFVQQELAAAVLGLFDHKGNVDCSANPNFPSASKGDVYRVSVAGKIGGVSGTVVSVGDWIIALADNPGGTLGAVGSSWDVWEGNIPGITSDGLTLIQAASFAAMRAELDLEAGVDFNAYRAEVGRLDVQGSDIASATTPDIGAATGDFINITGTTTITGFAAVTAGFRRLLKFAGVLQLTHHATSMILPTGANITTAAGDIAEFVSLGSGNWCCIRYQRASGAALVGGAGGAGGALARGDGVIQGHTTPETPAASPPQLFFTFTETAPAMEGTLTFNFDGVSYTVYFSASNPSQTFWVDTTSITDDAGMAAGLAACIAANISGITSSDLMNYGGVQFDNAGAGASYSSNVTDQYGVYGSATGGGSGTDPVPASGSVVEAQLISLASGKTTKAVRVGWTGDGVNAIIQVALKTAGGSYSPLGTISASSTLGETIPIAATISTWLTGVSEAHVVARMVDEEGNNIAEGNVPEGGSLSPWAIAEQI